MTTKRPAKTVASARISKDRRRLAESCCEQRGERLTPARLGAYAELLSGDGAMTAYELIGRLEKRQGRKIAPLTVYRHLDFLTRVGLAHRIELNQSYIPCEHPGDVHESQYLLCSDCGRVEEVHADQLQASVKNLAEARGFKPTRTVVEVSGICAKCEKS